MSWTHCLSAIQSLALIVSALLHCIRLIRATAPASLYLIDLSTCHTDVFVDANSYWSCNNAHSVGPFTRPVIFTLSLMFIFVLLIPPESLSHLYLQLLLDAHPCYGSAQARGPEIDSDQSFTGYTRCKLRDPNSGPRPSRRTAYFEGSLMDAASGRDGD